MKKLMLAAAVIFASVSAFASKARLTALQNAEHLEDMQRVVTDKPEQILNFEAAEIEFGGNSGGSNTNAEGGFIRKMGDSAWGLYLGKNSPTFATSTGALATALSAGGGATKSDEAAALNSAFNQINTMQLTYGSKAGDMTWAAGLFYGSTDRKTADTYASNAETLDASVKENIAGLLLGATNGTWDAQLRLGLGGDLQLNNVANSTIAGVANGDVLKLQSTSSYRVSGGYTMGTMYYYGSYAGAEGNVKQNGAKISDATSSDITVGAINSLKKDGVDFFYGASVVVTEAKDTTANTKVDTTKVPLLIGVEAEANSWLTLRAALSQSFGPFSSTKSKGSSATAVTDDTTTTVGAGVKVGKAMIDWVAGTGSTGTMGFDQASNTFTNIGLTYNF